MRIMDINKDTQFKPSDFCNSLYRCVNRHNRKDKHPVLMMASNDSNPPHWLVVDDTKQMVYLEYADAIAYCKRQGYVK